MSSKHESDLIKAIEEKRLFDEIMPAIRAAIKAGGGADQVLKKSETLAAMRLIEATNSDKEDVRLKAATEILNRTIGKPVERSVNIYGDISKLNERDIDNQIMMLFEKQGAKQLLASTGIAHPRSKQKRKPRKSDPLVIEATFTEQAEGTHASTEAGTPTDPKDEGTAR
jgi:hypothetical protein